MKKIFFKNLSIKSVLIYLLLIFASFLLVLFNTSLSPLYNPSYITHDASVFYVIGRGMKEGLLPYKDLFDHKGIYIYFLYYIAALIGEKNQIGLYIVFSVLTSIFSIFSYKITTVINKKIISNIFTAILLTILSVSMYFSHGALLCEYVALITITISIYIFVKDVFDGFRLSPIRMFFHGILCAINIFCKANYALYFVGLGIFILYELLLVKKDVKLLIKNVIYGFIGLLVGFMPGIIYCAINGIIPDMIFAVFTFDFSYVDDLSVDLPEGITTKGEAFLHCLSTYMAVCICVLFSFIVFIYTLKKDKTNKFIKVFIFYIITGISLLISVFMALTSYSHYTMLLIPYMMPFVLLFFNGLCDIYGNKKINKLVYIVVASFALLIMSYAVGGNYLRMNFDTTAIEHRKIKKTLSKYTKFNKKSNILCFGLGSGIYNYLEILPKEKYFYIPGISYSKFAAPVDSLIENIESYNFEIVTYAANRVVVEYAGNKVLEFLENNYVKVMDLSEFKKVFVRKDIYEAGENE